jgi:hypothetical protein
MKKVIKIFTVFTIALTVTAGVASAEWLRCTPTEAVAIDDGSVHIKLTGCQGFMEPNKNFKWISADAPGAERALAITLTAITLGKNITFDTIGDKNQYLPSVRAVGLK